MEMNESEPLMRCRESGTFCQKLQRYECSYKCGSNLFTVRMTGVIQAAWTLYRLNYGTREPARQCEGKWTI